MAEKEQGKYSAFQWFLYVILIPLAFAITVGLVVMTFAGVNVFDAAKEYGNKIPVIGNLFGKDNARSVEQYEKDLADLEGKIKNRDTKIDQLRTKLEEKEHTIDNEQIAKEKLQKEIDELTAIQQDNKRALKDIIQTYETMPVKKSAPIIAAMPEEQALKILSSIKPETLSGIMQNMEPAKAAKFTQMLTNQIEGNADLGQ